MTNPFFSNIPLVTTLRTLRTCLNSEYVESPSTEDIRVFVRYNTDGSYTTEIKDLGKMTAANCYIRFEGYADSSHGATISLQVRVGDDSGQWSSWRTFNNGELLRFRYVQWRVLFHAEDFSYRPNVRMFQIVIDVPDVYKAGDFTVPVGGGEVEYGYDFFIVPYVVASALGTKRKAEVLSKGKTSCTIRVVDESGVDVGGPGDWHAKGY